MSSTRTVFNTPAPGNRSGGAQLELRRSGASIHRPMLAFVLVGASHLPPAHTRRALLQPRSVHRLRGGLRTDSTDAADVHLGLRNQGNTCYMNSLLQVLYHVPEFRRAIYSLPTSTAAELGTSSRVVLELQRLFYRLQVQP